MTHQETSRHRRRIIEKGLRVNNHPAAGKTTLESNDLNLVQTTIRTQGPLPATAASANDTCIPNKIKLESIWRPIAREVSRGAKLGLAGEALMGALTAVGSYISGDVANAVGDTMNSITPMLYNNAPEDIGCAAFVIGATGVALALAKSKKITAPNETRNFPRAANLVCQVVGVALPLVAGYGVLKGFEKYEDMSMASAPQAMMVKQPTAATLTPR